MTGHAQTVWEGINLCHTFADRRDGLINDHVSRWLNDLKLRHAPILLDADLYQHGNLVAGWRRRCRLNPGAVKTIVQHVAIPAELRRRTRAAGLPPSDDRKEKVNSEKKRIAKESLDNKRAKDSPGG